MVGSVHIIERVICVRHDVGYFFDDVVNIYSPNLAANHRLIRSFLVNPVESSLMTFANAGPQDYDIKRCNTLHN